MFNQNKAEGKVFFAPHHASCEIYFQGYLHNKACDLQRKQGKLLDDISLSLSKS